MPMDRSAVEAICDAAMPAMRDALWANDTRITMVYGACSDSNWAAECDRNAPYRRATITIDPAQHDDEAEVLDSLRHEVLHLTLGEFDVYANMVQTNIDDSNGTAAAVESRAFTLAVERTINRLEVTLDGLGWSATALAGKDTTCAACGKTWRAIAPDDTEAVDCPKCGEKVTHGRTEADSNPS